MRKEITPEVEKIILISGNFGWDVLEMVKDNQKVAIISVEELLPYPE